MSPVFVANPYEEKATTSRPTFVINPALVPRLGLDTTANTDFPCLPKEIPLVTLLAFVFLN